MLREIVRFLLSRQTRHPNDHDRGADAKRRDARGCISGQK
jgi:hypothetical protein